MRSMRTVAAAAVLMLLMMADTSSAQTCTSDVRQLTPHSFNDLVPESVAFADSMIALALTEERTGAAWVSLYSQGGDLLYPSVKLPSTESASILRLLWNGDHFGLFLRTEEDKIQLRRINTTGEYFGAAVNILPNVTLTDADDIDIIWSSQLQNYIIARTTGSPAQRVWVTYLHREGTLKRDIEIATPTEDSFVRLAMTPSGTLGVFYKAAPTGVLTYMRVREDERNFSRELGTAGEDLLVVTKGEQFVLAQTIVDPDDGRRAIEWMIIDTDGFETRPKARLLVGTGEDVDALSLLALDHEFAISYLDARDGFDQEEGSLRLRRFNAEGETISDTLFAIADRTRHRASGENLLFTGSSYLTVAVRTWEDDEDETFLIRFCPLRATIDAPRFALRGSTVTFTGIAEGGQPDYEYEWEYSSPFGVASGKTLQLTFSTPGDYHLTLRVEDESGAEVAQSFTITILDPPPPPKPPRRRSVRK